MRVCGPWTDTLSALLVKLADASRADTFGSSVEIVKGLGRAGGSVAGSIQRLSGRIAISLQPPALSAAPWVVKTARTFAFSTTTSRAAASVTEAMGASAG